MRILSWNVQWFQGIDGRVDMARVLREARMFADPDVLCFQEVAIGETSLTGRTARDQLAALQRHLPGWTVWFASGVDDVLSQGPMQTGQSFARFGNVLATRLPVRHVRRGSLPYPSSWDAAQTMPRCWLAVTVEADIGPAVIVTTHLEYASAEHRMLQVRALRDLYRCDQELAARPPPGEFDGPFRHRVFPAAWLVCGDFNMIPGSPEYRELIGHDTAGGLIDAFSVARPAVAHTPTFRCFDQRYGKTPVCCDFFFVSEALAPKISVFRTHEATRVSDHQPIMLELTSSSPGSQSTSALPSRRGSTPVRQRPSLRKSA